MSQRQLLYIAAILTILLVLFLILEFTSLGNI